MNKLLLTLFLSIGFIGSPHAEENWSLIGDSRLITRGEIVWGHQFGFMKDLSICDYDILLVSWSSDISDGQLKAFEGNDAYLQINIDGEVLKDELEFTLITVGKLDSMEIGYFGAIVNSDTFVERLKQSSKVELTFTKPKSLLKILDIQSDSFKTEGLNSSYSLLDNSCPN